MKFLLTLAAMLVSLNLYAKSPNIDQLDCVATAIYLEARGKQFAHQVGIAKVVYKRAKLQSKSYCEVVSEHGLFSAYSDKKAKQLKKANSVDFQDARLIAIMAINHRDPTNGATNFQHISIKHSSKKYDQTAILDEHKFLVDKELIQK